MTIKGCHLLVMSLLVFGGYAVYDYFNEKTQSEKKMQESRLMTLNFEQVQEVEFKKGENKLLAKRDVDGWRLQEPLQDLADNDALDDLIKSAFTETIIDVVKEGRDIDWKLYGLDQALGEMTFKTTDGKQNHYVISSLKNFEENAYARRNNEDRVLLVNSVWQSRVSKSVNDLRDRRFLRHKIASVDEILLKNSKGVFHVKRHENQWSSVEKSDLKLDQNKVRNLLTSIAGARAAEILPVSQKISLAKDLFTLSLTMDGKKWSAQVQQAVDKKIYAKVSEPEFLLKMDPGALDSFIDVTIQEFKEKTSEKESKTNTNQKDK